MKYAQILSDRMNALGMSKQQLSDLSGVPYMTVSGILRKGAARAGVQNVLALCKVLDIDPNAFIGMVDASSYTGRSWSRSLVDAYSVATKPTQENVCKLLDISHVVPDDPPEDPEEETISILTFTHSSAAGLPRYVDSDYEHMDFPRSQVPSGADFAIHINGDSMEPTIQDDSYVFVKRQEELCDGQIGIFMLGDTAVCKRYRRGEDSACLLSDNPRHVPIELVEDAECRVVGRVLGYR